MGRRQLTNKIKQNKYLPGDVNDFIGNNLGLVYKVCEGFRNAQAEYRKSLDEEDFFQIGCMGLLYAYNRYNGQGEFSTYAMPCIRGFILRQLYHTNHGVSYPKRSKEYATKIIKLKLEKSPVASICQKLGASKRQALEALNFIEQGKPLSIYSKSLNNDNEETDYSYVNTLPDPRLETWERDLIVRLFADTLNETAQKVMWATIAGYSTRQVGAQIGLSQTRVAMIWRQVLVDAEAYGQGLYRLKTKPKKMAHAQ